MPTLDNYSLGNYGLGGVVQSSALVQTPAINEYVTVNPGFSGNLRTIAEIPPSSLISLTPTNSATGRIVVIPQNSLINFALALIDQAGRIWILTGSNNASTSYFTLQISEVGVTSIYSNDSSYMNTATAKVVFNGGKPADFNMKGNMALCLWVTNTAVSTATNMQLLCSTMRLVSA